MCTDVQTGKPVYHKCETGDDKDITYIRASASMPVFARNVEIDGMELSDGGTADSIPLRYFESIGYDKNVVILTQPADYRKEANKFLPYIRRKLRKTPNLVHALEDRHLRYNETLDYIKTQEEALPRSKLKSYKHFFNVENPYKL